MHQLFQVFRSVRRRLLIHRRGLAALCAGAAILIGINAVRTPATEMIPIWTAAHDVDAGDRLTYADLRRTGFPPDVVPPSAVRDPTRLLGRTVVRPLEEGQPLSARQVLGRAALTSYPGRVAVAVRLPDAGLAGLLRHGDRINLWVTDPRTPGPSTLAVAGALVLTQGTRESADEIGTGVVVVLAVAPADVAKVASSTSAGLLSVSWNR